MERKKRKMRGRKNIIIKYIERMLGERKNNRENKSSLQYREPDLASAGMEEKKVRSL